MNPYPEGSINWHIEELEKEIRKYIPEFHKLGMSIDEFEERYSKLPLMDMTKVSQLLAKGEVLEEIKAKVEARRNDVKYNSISPPYGQPPHGDYPNIRIDELTQLLGDGGGE